MNILSRLLPAICILLMQVITGCATSQAPAVLTTETDPSGKPLNQSSAFAVDLPRIICSLDTTGLSASSQVSAGWSYNDSGTWKPLKQEKLTVANSAYLLFALEAPATGWATGSYAVKLTSGSITTEKAFSIKSDPSVKVPAINNFSTTPATVASGQQFTLNWNVSGASRVIISPDIGSVEAGGSRLLTATADRTYVLTAINSGGPTSMSISLIVTPVALEKAALVPVDIFREAGMLYYKVRNTGNAVSKPCNAALFQGPTRLATDYIAPLAPGEQRTEVFGTFSWSYSADTAVSVCVDIDNQNNESTQDNCLIKVIAAMRGL